MKTARTAATLAAAAALFLSACGGDESQPATESASTQPTAEATTDEAEEATDEASDEATDEAEEASPEPTIEVPDNGFTPQEVPDPATLTKEQFIELRAHSWTEFMLLQQERIASMTGTDLNDPMEIERTKMYSNGGSDLATCEADYFFGDEGYDMEEVALYSVDPVANIDGRLSPEFVTAAEEVLIECMEVVLYNSASGYYD